MEATKILRITRNRPPTLCTRISTAPYSTLRSGKAPRTGPRNRLSPSGPLASRTRHQHPLYAETLPQNYGYNPYLPGTPDPLSAPVNIPHDPHGILTPDHPSASILSNSAIIIQRQLELGNILLGFEQANKYVILDPQGNHIGYIAEEESGLAKILYRQWFRTHRSFTAHVFDKHQNQVLVFHRPFSFINSRIQAFDLQTSALIGESIQEWALLRRKYNLFLAHDPPTPSSSTPAGTSLDNYNPRGEQQMSQFAYVDEPFLSWDFSLMDANNSQLGSVNRNFGGFGREIFTDTGSYVLEMDCASKAEVATGNGEEAMDKRVFGNEGRGMTLDERAVMLATAVCIDFDYFSRHSRGIGGHGGMFPGFMMFPGMYGGGGGSGDGGAAGGGGDVGGSSGGSGGDWGGWSE